MKKVIFTITFSLICCIQIFSQKTVIQDYRYNVYFDTNKDLLTPHAKLKLEKRLASLIQKDIVSIEIIGHTDIEGSLDFNMDLSKRRAQTVQQFIEKNGMERFPISTSFQGETSPSINENSETAKAANRRVEIWWMVREIMPVDEGTIISSKVCGNSLFHKPTEEKEIITPLTDYQKFHRQIDKTAQNFKIDNNKGGILEAKEGTIIHFYPNSFCDCKNKKNINGDVAIELKEYYELGDFLQAGLNTRNNDKTLQSAGTIHILASANDKEVCLKKGQDYEILFPKNRMNKENYKDIQLFAGNIDDNGEVNWGVMKRNSLLNKDAVTRNNRTRACINCGVEKEKFFGRVADFFVKNWAWRGYKYWRSPAGQEVAKKNREKFRTEQLLRDELANNFDGTFSELTQKLKKAGINSAEYVFNYYITSANQLNYINCDRFLNLPKKKLHTVNLAFQGHENISSKLIISYYKSIAKGMSHNDGYYFPNLPKGKKAQIILYDYSGKSPKLAKLDIVIGKAINTADIVFKEYNMKDFKEQLMALN